MKTTLLLLSAILISTGALADVRVDSFNVTGPKAVAIEKSLIAAGARTTAMMDTSNLSVSNVDCEAGFAEHAGGGHFSKCTFQQMRSPICRPGQACSHMIMNVDLEVSGRKATAISVALENAGVKAEQGRETVRRFAVRISCHAMMSGAGRLTSCAIDVPGGM